MTDVPRIVPVILSGGSGTRLWPMSRTDRPKQFLPLTAEATMFQLTLERASDPERFAAPIVVAGARHAGLIETQLDGRAATLLLEPLAKNTAPAIALAALAAPADAPMLVMPSDHVIADPAAFMAAVDVALPLVERGWLATFGIAPDAPETGYGYIQVGEEIAPGAHRVARFAEKPDAATAEAMLASGDHVWNGGIFLFRADAYLRALGQHAPAMLDAARAAMDAAVREGARILPDAEAFAASPSDSIDYAVMEKADRVAVVPVAMGWSDVGSWDALHALNVDAQGNCHGGDVIALDTDNCLLRSDGIRIAAVGVSNLIVVASGDSVLILPRGRSQEVKRVVEAIREREA
ncbi:MAG: mannose-1-phosphate guanylyltransferase/mannose-6-phosphate isomerase [Sphingomonadaceae bacterium]|nr:mannose-1-phosphate guanylyltransferase/mannose-6-phosphate isomerase [Sphingomonadaceae bacterium]